MPNESTRVTSGMHNRAMDRKRSHHRAPWEPPHGFEKHRLIKRRFGTRPSGSLGTPTPRVPSSLPRRLARAQVASSPESRAQRRELRVVFGRNASPLYTPGARLDPRSSAWRPHASLRSSIRTSSRLHQEFMLLAPSRRFHGYMYNIETYLSFRLAPRPHAVHTHPQCAHAWHTPTTRFPRVRHDSLVPATRPTRSHANILLDSKNIL